MSVLSLVSISVNRYLHVCHYRFYQRMFTKSRTSVTCIACWVLGFMLSLPPLVGVGSYCYYPKAHVCSFCREGHQIYPKVVIAVLTIIPMCIIGYCNYSIFRYWKTAYSAKNKAQRFQKKPKRKERNVRPSSGNEAELPNVTFDPENDPVSTTNESDYTRDWRRTANSCPMVHPHHRSSQAGNRKSGRQVDASTDNLSEDVLTSIEAPDELEECSRTPDSDLCSSSEEYSRFPSDTCNPQSSITRSEEQTAGQKGLDTRLDGEACCEALRSEVDKEHHDSEKHATDENGDEQSKETLSGGNHEDLEAELPNNQKSSVRKFPFKSNSTRTKGKPLKEFKTNRNTFAQHVKYKGEKRRAKEKAFVRSLFVVVVLFFCCFLPFTLVHAVDSYRQLAPEVVISADLLMFFSSTVNWIVYGVMNPSFRRGYKKLLSRVQWALCRRPDSLELGVGGSMSSLTISWSRCTKTQ